MENQYVITLKARDDIENFIEDGKNSSLINRSIFPKIKKNQGRSLLYTITLEETIEIKKDARVQSIELLAIIANSIQPMYNQNANWDKSSTNNASHRNWALYRCILDNNVENWGSNNTSSQNISFDLSGGLGRNVDVVIIDGHYNPAHPEMALNENGTGGSRVNQINWFIYTDQAVELDDDGMLGYSGTYTYTPYLPGGQGSLNNNHGMHVAGTVAGNRQGWAKKASLYNINPYSTNANVDQFFAFIMWDYIRAFHLNKPINSTTGRRNPTICNGSYGSRYLFPFDYGTVQTGPIKEIVYRGTTYLPSGDTFTDTELENFGIYMVSSGVAEVPYYSDSIAADIEDAVADGIIVVGSAGNSYSYIDSPGGIDYDNYFLADFDGIEYAWYFNRGSAPGSVPGVICVGAVSALTNETKATYSNTGPRIDIFAPGNNIMSAILSDAASVLDSRNPSYRNVKYNGTSMASPQVTGVLSCLLETYPRMTPSQALDFIVSKSKLNKMTDTDGGLTDDTSLKGAENRYLFYQPERLNSGSVYPQQKYGLRTAQGQVFPRSRIYRYGS